jgi:aspartate-semialdehyde dehydrogenase
MSKLPVAVLGATGAVGQAFIARLADHPWFEVAQVAASAERVGLRYGETVRWREARPLPAAVAALPCTTTEPAAGIRIAFSALDAAVARDVEPALAAAGVLVVSNASAFRMAADVPLVIPEVNPGHLALLGHQRAQRGWAGGIVANPNCSTAALVTALAPLDRAFGLERAVVATLQAASGAGYPGVPSLDLLDNVIPYIAGEEEKIEAECRKLLGTHDTHAIREATLTVSAMVHRVPVLDGHLVSASLAFRRIPSVEEAVAALEAFRGDATVAGLPTSPARPIEVDARVDRPQPRLDRDRGQGMTVTVGRVRPCPVHHLRFVALGHNLVRGAAGAAIQNAELCVAEGVL